MSSPQVQICSISVDIYDDIFENFIFVGRRDYLKNYYYNHEYVPCVSCKLDLLQNSYKIKRTFNAKKVIINGSWSSKFDTLKYKPTLLLC